MFRKRRNAFLTVTAAWLISANAAGQSAESAVPQKLLVDINAQQTGEPASKYEFGMFIEHIAALVYRSLWAEMLDDRKFYFPITSAVPESQARPQGGGFRGMQLRKWQPVGPEGAVVMDKDHPFVGDQVRALSWMPPLRMAFGNRDWLW